MRNQIEYKLTGRYALFTDPITKVGGEKCTLPVPTYQALKGITESIYWKPTVIWYVDEVRIMNPIRTESKNMRVINFGTKGDTTDLSMYTYLYDVEYRVRAHFEFNMHRPDLEADRNENKHHNNALLSFAYSILGNEIAAALETVGMDPYIGFLHKVRPGRQSLALDMLEELRSPVADRFVLTLINLGIFNEADFITKENGAVVLTDDSRKRFLSEWQKHKQEEITHPYLNEKINWGLVPYVQATLLSRYFRDDIDAYPPFLWK